MTNPPTPALRVGQLTLFIFALSLGTSAALLFNIQPLIGKMLLPKVGGAPAVWNVAMAFFQCVLLLGYLLAHGLSRLSPRLHGLAYVAVLAAAFMSLPISLPADWQPDPQAFPPAAILLILLHTVGLPFLALAMSAPTLQRLFASTGHKDAADPYFLYAASNLGSFIGLFAYPLWLEPSYTVAEQADLWRWANLGFVVLAVATLLFVGKPAATTTHTTKAPPLRWGQRGVWVALAAIPSSLTLGTTTFVTTDIAALPLLWAVILGLYLLTFILAFHPPRWLKANNVYDWQPPLMAGALFMPMLGSHVASHVVMLVALAAFFVAALVCHLRLAQLRPAPQHLTEYYLWMSVGGALGGAITAFVLPVVFGTAAEFALVLLLTLAANPQKGWGSDRGRIITLCGFTAVMAFFSLRPFMDPAYYNVALLTLYGLAIFAVLKRRHYMVTIAATLVAVVVFPDLGDLRYGDRNFFGVTRVTDMVAAPEDGRTFRQLNHGTTRHGTQVIAPAPVNEPNGYYTRQGPLGTIMQNTSLQRIAVIGLGSGNMNCYMAPGRSFHFFEIDPMMVEVAQNYFTFLKDCSPAQVTVGDGRLMLASDKTGLYDAVVLDAFSSDFIPAHLLTTDALAVYLQHLKPDGVIVLHISNRFFDLAPVLARNAAALNLSAALGQTVPAHDKSLNYPSIWVAMARDKSYLAPYIGQNGWQWLTADMARRPWTDGYSNLLSALK